MLPQFTIRVYSHDGVMPPEAEALFTQQLADSRQQSEHINGAWRFALILAIADENHVLGGVHLDIGPIGGSGPLAQHRLAYLERTLVRPKYRRQGLATQLLRRAMDVAAEAGCLYIRCSNNWDNPAETALFLRCGFALVDNDGENDPEPCYLAVRPVQNL